MVLAVDVPAERWFLSGVNVEAFSGRGGRVGRAGSGSVSDYATYRDSGLHRVGFVFYKLLVPDFYSFYVFVTEIANVKSSKSELLATLRIHPSNEDFIRAVLKQNRNQCAAERVIIT